MDNNSYNIIMALASNLEAREAYKKYAKDGNSELWQKLAQQTDQAIQMLQQQLPQVQGAQAQSSGYTDASNFGAQASSGSVGGNTNR